MYHCKQGIFHGLFKPSGVRNCNCRFLLLPQDYEGKLINFQRFIIAKRKQHNYELRHIGNADQTPMTFDIVLNSTVDKKGSKTVSILTTGHEKDRFTVMLACLGDGTKLPPYDVFKRKTLPKKITFPNGVIVPCQEKEWMDEAMIKDWLKTVWSKVGGLRKTKSLLVCHSFRAHLSQPTKRIVTSSNTETAVIPGGMISCITANKEFSMVCLNQVVLGTATVGFFYCNRLPLPSPMQNP